MVHLMAQPVYWICMVGTFLAYLREDDTFREFIQNLVVAFFWPVTWVVLFVGILRKFGR